MQSHRRRLVLLLTLILSVGTQYATAPGARANKRTAPVALYHLILDAQMKTQAADVKMLAYMDQVSDLLSQLYRRTHKFPETTSDFERLASTRGVLLDTKNPYLESELLARELPQTTPPHLKFEVIPEFGLSRSGLDAQAKSPPRSWLGTPGSITIMHNSENTYAIRACSFDGKPVIDRTTGSAAYVFRDFSLAY